MQFNSFIFILLFLPITVIAYFAANRINKSVGKAVVIIASAFFYIYSDPKASLALGVSVLLNYSFSVLISKRHERNGLLRVVPIVINVGLLLFYKYVNFAITNVNYLFGRDLKLMDLVMPVGISFFTFQQIAYLVAVSNRELENISFVDYLAYILYFPKILMGPLMEPVDFIRQVNNDDLKKTNWDNIACGIKMFSLGLFKKVMIADVFSGAVSWGFTNMTTTTAVDWIFIMLFYSFEIYFDFSGYSDMAVGASLMLNITLPINFDSPYKALSVRDFWKRWHMSLTGFFTKYIYIPLGGSRRGKLRTYMNTLFIFLISGLWHGANWTFILWGLLHGLLMVFDRVFDKIENKVFKPVRWILTFGVINFLWLLFRADSITQWLRIVKQIFSMEETKISKGLINKLAIPEISFVEKTLHMTETDPFRMVWMFLFIAGVLTLCLFPRNNYRNIKKITAGSMILAFLAFVWGFICLSGESVFVYFMF